MANYNFFKLDDARKEGYSDNEILGEIQRQAGSDFDAQGAFKEGYSLDDIVGEIDKRRSRFVQPAAPAQPVIPQAITVQPAIAAAPLAQPPVAAQPAKIATDQLAQSSMSTRQAMGLKALDAIPKERVPEFQQKEKERLESASFAKPDFNPNTDAPWNDPSLTPLQRKWAKYKSEDQTVNPEDADWAFTPAERAQIKQENLEAKLKHIVPMAIDYAGMGLMGIGALGALETGGLSELGAFGLKAGLGYGAQKAAEYGLEKTGVSSALSEAAQKLREVQQPYIEAAVKAGMPARLASFQGAAAPAALEALPFIASLAAGAGGWKAGGAGLSALGKGAGVAAPVSAEAVPLRALIEPTVAPEGAPVEVAPIVKPRLYEGPQGPMKSEPYVASAPELKPLESTINGLPTRDDLYNAVYNSTGRSLGSPRLKELPQVGKEAGVRGAAADVMGLPTLEEAGAAGVRAARQAAQGMAPEATIGSAYVEGRPVSSDMLNAMLDMAAHEDKTWTAARPKFAPGEGAEPRVAEAAPEVTRALEGKTPSQIADTVSQMPEPIKRQAETALIEAASQPETSVSQQAAVDAIKPHIVDTLEAGGDLNGTQNNTANNPFYQKPGFIQGLRRMFYKGTLEDVKFEAVRRLTPEELKDPAKVSHAAMDDMLHMPPSDFLSGGPLYHLAALKQWNPGLAERLSTVKNVIGNNIGREFANAFDEVLEGAQPSKVPGVGFRWQKAFEGPKGDGVVPEEMIQWKKMARRIPSGQVVGVTNMEALASVADGKVDASLLPENMRGLVEPYRKIMDRLADLEGIPKSMRRELYMTHVINHPEALAEIANSPTLNKDYFVSGGIKGAIPTDPFLKKRMDLSGFETDLRKAFHARLQQAIRKVTIDPLAAEIDMELQPKNIEATMRELGYKTPAEIKTQGAQYAERLRRTKDALMGIPDSSYQTMDAIMQSMTPDFIRNTLAKMDKTSAVNFLRQKGFTDGYIQNLLPGPGWTRAGLNTVAKDIATAYVGGSLKIPFWEFFSRGVVNNASREGIWNTAKGTASMLTDSVKKLFGAQTQQQRKGLPPSPLGNMLNDGIDWANTPGMLEKARLLTLAPAKWSASLGYALTQHSAMFKGAADYAAFIKRAQAKGLPVEWTAEGELTAMRRRVANAFTINEHQAGSPYQPPLADKAYGRLLFVFRMYPTQRAAFFANLWKGPATAKVGGVPVGVWRYLALSGLPYLAAKEAGVDLGHWLGVGHKPEELGVAPEGFSEEHPVISAIIQSPLVQVPAEGVFAATGGPLLEPVKELVKGARGKPGQAIVNLATALGLGTLGPATALARLRDWQYESQTGFKPKYEPNLFKRLFGEQEPGRPVTEEDKLARMLGGRPIRMDQGKRPK